MCVHFICEFDFYAILNIQLYNRNKVTSKNIHYVSVSSIQFNQQHSLHLNLKFSQTRIWLKSNWHGRGFLMYTDLLIENRLNERLSVERSLHDINTGVQNQRLVAYPVMIYQCVRSIETKTLGYGSFLIVHIKIIVRKRIVTIAN